MKDIINWEWDFYSIRRFCIKHNLYTCGDNRAYNEMLNFVDENDPTEERVRLVVIDIVAHSESYSIYKDVDNMFNLLVSEVLER